MISNVKGRLRKKNKLRTSCIYSVLLKKLIRDSRKFKIAKTRQILLRIVEMLEWKELQKSCFINIARISANCVSVPCKAI